MALALSLPSTACNAPADPGLGTHSISQLKEWLANSSHSRQSSHLNRSLPTAATNEPWQQRWISSLLGFVTTLTSLHVHDSVVKHDRLPSTTLSSSEQQRTLSRSFDTKQEICTLHKSQDNCSRENNHDGRASGDRHSPSPSSGTTSTRIAIAPARSDGHSMSSASVGQKRRLNTLERDGGKDGDRDEDEDEFKRKRKSGPLSPPTEAQQRNFACPFYKRDPATYMNQRICPGPGWKTVHRMKEHLYRAHMRPEECERCRQQFQSRNELRAHQRADEACPIQPLQHVEGITLSQQMLLKSRKKAAGCQTEHEKWYQVYNILFPDDDPLSVPSPYYEPELTSDISGSKHTENAVPRQLSPQFLDQLRQELESKLFQRFEQNELAASLRPRITEIIRDAFDEVLAGMTRVSPEVKEKPEADLEASSSENHSDAIGYHAPTTEVLSLSSQLEFSRYDSLAGGGALHTDHSELSRSTDLGYDFLQDLDFHLWDPVTSENIGSKSYVPAKADTLLPWRHTFSTDTYPSVESFHVGVVEESQTDTNRSIYEL